MSKIKVLLNVVEGLRNLADSMAELADVIASSEESTPGSGGNTAQTTLVAPHSAENVPNESQQGATSKPEQQPSQPAQEDDTPKLDLVTLRAAVAEYSTPENRPKIKEILTHFGVKKLTELREDQYTALFSEVVQACEK